MALTKRTYVDGETIITAQNLNDIQDEVRGNIRNVSYNTTSGKIQKTTNSGTTSDVVTVDATPTQNSKNPVQSGGVYTKISDLDGALTNIGSLTTASITTQVDALGSGEYVGTVTGSTTGLPVATSGVIQAVIYNTNYKRIFYYPNGGADVVYVLAKSGGTWQSTWTLLPSRSEVDGKVPTSRTVNGKSLSDNVTLASGDIGDDSGAGGATVKASLTALANAWNPATITSVVKEETTVTLNAYNVYKIGRMVFIYINITLSQQLATNTNILSGLPGAVATWTFLGGSAESNALSMFYVSSGGYLRNSGTAPAEHFLIVGTYISGS